MVEKHIIDNVLEDIFSSPLFPDEPEGLYSPLEYMVSIGGKRLRPRLCLTSYSFFSGDFGPGIRGAAKALELYHTFTLIHDDIMDKSPLRRSHETVWKKWGEETAILSGDEMINQSLLSLMAVPSERLRPAMELLVKTSSDVCRGQQYDMEFENELHVTMERYLMMTGLKTSALLACSAKMGAVVAGAADKTCDALYRYGWNLGLAFQIADDYLDAYGDPAVFGKPIGGDILNNKKSWMLTRCNEKRPGCLDAILGMPVSTQEQKKAKVAAAMEVYSSLSLGSEARAEILRFHNLALEDAASAFGARTPEYKCLEEIASKLVGRTK